MEEREGAQPFTRCASCQMDNTIYAAACLNCGAALDTPAQRAFNERFWAERQAQAEAERRELAEREKVRQKEAADQARQQRELGEEIARRERERVDADFPDGPFQRPGSDTTGMRLLRLLPGTGLRIGAAVVAIGLPLLLLLFGRGMPQLVGMVLLGILVALFSPSRRRTRRW
jgi:Flp pilus assembly protein TadB